MNRAIAIGILVVGVVLIIFGVNASNSIGSSVSRAFTGTPTNHSMWLLIGGIAMAVVGLVLSIRGAGSSKS
jgi:predicted benzoate:H+ symporter BenE